MAASVNISKGPPPPATLEEAEDLVELARCLLEEDKPRGAVPPLMRLLQYPSPMLADYHVLVRALRLFSDASIMIDGENELAAAAREAAIASDSPPALYNFARQLEENSQFSLAAGVLRQAHSLAPEDGAILELLVANLINGQMYMEAVSLLQSTPKMVEDFPSCRAQLAWSAVMKGDLDLARKTYAPFLDEAERRRDPSEMAAMVRIILQRADALQPVSPLDGRDLRGWHYVLNGGLLLHVSPYGFDDGMNGRYCWVKDSAERCREGILRLKAVLEAQGTTVPRVFILPDLKSAILSHALASALECEAVPWPEGGSKEPGIVVAYDLDQLDVTLLRTVFVWSPGQLLWAHAVCWTMMERYIPRPDFITFFYQTVVSPWEESHFTPIGGRVEPREDEKLLPENQAVLSSRILEAELDNNMGDALEDMPALIAVAKVMKDQWPDIPSSPTVYRMTHLPGSPVPSNRF